MASPAASGGARDQPRGGAAGAGRTASPRPQGGGQCKQSGLCGRDQGGCSRSRAGISVVLGLGRTWVFWGDSAGTGSLTSWCGSPQARQRTCIPGSGSFGFTQGAPCHARRPGWASFSLRSWSPASGGGGAVCVGVPEGRDSSAQVASLWLRGKRGAWEWGALPPRIPQGSGLTRCQGTGQLVLPPHPHTPGAAPGWPASPCPSATPGASVVMPCGGKLPVESHAQSRSGTRSPRPPPGPRAPPGSCCP